MQPVVNLPGFAVLHDPVLNWLHVQWRGPHAAPFIRACCAEILTQVACTGSTKILNDGLLDLDGWQQAVQWIRHESLPQLVAHGVVAIAWVLPQDIRAQTHVHQTIAHVTQPLMDTFRDVESAYAWLRQLPGQHLAAS